MNSRKLFKAKRLLERYAATGVIDRYVIDRALRLAGLDSTPENVAALMPPDPPKIAPLAPVIDLAPSSRRTKPERPNPKPPKARDDKPKRKPKASK